MGIVWCNNILSLLMVVYFVCLVVFKRVVWSGLYIILVIIVLVCSLFKGMWNFCLLVILSEVVFIIVVVFLMILLVCIYLIILILVLKLLCNVLVFECVWFVNKIFGVFVFNKDVIIVCDVLLVLKINVGLVDFC